MQKAHSSIESRHSNRQIVLVTTRTSSAPDVGYLSIPTVAPFFWSLQIRLLRDAKGTDISGWKLRAGLVSKQEFMRQPRQIRITQAVAPGWAWEICRKVHHVIRGSGFNVHADGGLPFYPARGEISLEDLEQKHLSMYFFWEYWEAYRPKLKDRITDMERLGITITHTNRDLGNIFKSIGLKCRRSPSRTTKKKKIS